MIVGLLLLAVLCNSLPFLVGIVILSSAYSVTAFNEPSLTTPGFVVLCVLALSIPAAAMFAGALLDRFCFGRFHNEPLSRLSVVLSTLFILSPQIGLDYLLEILSLLQRSDHPHFMSAMMRICSGALFCGALSAFAIMVVVALFELTSQWFLHLCGSHNVPSVSLTGLRTTLVVTLCFWCMGLMVDLVEHEYAPQQLLYGMKDVKNLSP